MSNKKEIFPQIYLASASPRRCELLQQIGIQFEQFICDLDESVLENETPSDYVQRLALAKASTAYERLNQPNCPVLGADTTVVIDDQILAKPINREDSIAMLERLSNREHQVLSAVALVLGEQKAVRLQTSQVQFRALSRDQMERYWESGEPADKAGSYGIQGLGAAFVRQLQGSHSGVMGLPLFETIELLGEFGIDIF